ncbi:efflux RND transporter periplasmic adaptor subunit [Reichenbachiella agarivorans]|uniref:Efflux RND transporter periplasmic adaptor subunit n=1 Tax=Reichenbachiella agarivorans TaxID=2979464 RepID=A0ABY6CM62_9BACT|nr:efflux RND transporter periplasmic adaptor subunit [Reichenbachiella agarivorans]UXP31591.1 efflux RND transporter periplasmic adaptor subunit [Reichenbachiella agarivorans]
MTNLYKKHIQHSLLIGLLLIAMVACNSPSSSEGEHDEHEDEAGIVELTQAQYEHSKLQTAKISKRNIGAELKVNGIIDVPPQSNISINMPYGGFVKYIDMLPGTVVKKGQFLVSIENPEFIQFQQDYLESLANRSFLEEEYKRQEQLYNEKVASAKSYQQAKSSYLGNEAKLQSMEARLKMIGFNPDKVKNGKISTAVSIYSPVSGSVRAVHTNVGKYINPQDVIMDITNSDDLHVELTVYENDIPKIKKGQRIRFSLSNAPNEWREAEIFLIGTSVREDRSVTVHGHLQHHDTDSVYQDGLVPGMYITARIETDNAQVWAVPNDAVVRFGGKHFVFTFKGKEEENGQPVYQYEMLEVETGSTEDGYTQIAVNDSGIDLATLEIVSQGAFTLLAKSKNSEEEGGHHH